MSHYVIGHEKPDLDSVVSAIAIAELFTTDPNFGYSEVTPLLASEMNNEASYILDKFGVTAPEVLTEGRVGESDKIILVDHNEETQRAKGITSEQIVEIIDHHKINVSLQQPAYITTKPWGSTATIIFSMMRSHEYKPTQQTAQLLLSALLSDTVGLQSATTTDVDKEYAAELSQITGITDLKALSLEIFKAKSNINDLSPEQMVKNDYKIFEFGNKKVFIGQLETVEQETVVKKVAELVDAMKKIYSQEGADYIFLAVTDILNINTKLLFTNGDEQMLAEKAFGIEADHDHILDIGSKMSRKKEIAPAIESAVTSA